MIQQVRYQIFVSSTYEDLRVERQETTQAILEAGCFPSGMELFPASDQTQWELIKRVIIESDYFVTISAGRYGSPGPSGLSYTEMEYDFAVECGIPVLGFVRENLGEIAAETEKTDVGRDQLNSFRSKLLSRTCRKYSSPTELGMAVLKSLISEARIRPRVGWVRADQARSEGDVARERELLTNLAEANSLVEKLSRQIRDMAILRDEIPIEELAQGDDAIYLTAMYQDESKKIVSEQITTSYDSIFKIIGRPCMA